MSDEPEISSSAMLAAIDSGWETLHATLAQLSEAQMTTIQDAAGWTIRDHITHMTAWERSVLVMLQGQPRYLGLGIDEALYKSGDVDEINDAIYQQGRALSLEQALARFREVHAQIMPLLRSLSEDELRARRQPGRADSLRIYDVIINNTADHYEEHLGWIQSLAAS